MSAMQSKVVRAFLEGRSRRMALATPMHGGTRRYRYSTDGKSLYVWGSEVARRIRGAVYITDAGWLTLLTKSVLNEFMTQLGLNTRISSVRGKWKVWNFETQRAVDWPGRAVIKGGRMRLLPESGRHGIVFGGYTRRRRYVPLPPPKPKFPTLFNAKASANMHLPAERAEASKLFRRVYRIACNQLQRRDWLGASRSYGILTGLQHAAIIERPPLMRLVRSWDAALEEIVRIAKGVDSPDFWTVR